MSVMLYLPCDYKFCTRLFQVLITILHTYSVEHADIMPRPWPISHKFPQSPMRWQLASALLEITRRRPFSRASIHFYIGITQPTAIYDDPAGKNDP